ncbi:DUF6612 family protein [Halobacterium wangiae]|uniref:DUF6612 family protein n=1 Tax=Halobacterium wangiae TaxID=2902623 RepID=UPI001E4BDD72|nr:DUF6612 family protein [Halobacterium wangiae]
MQRRPLATLCVAALLVTAGCAGLTGDDGGASDAEQLRDDATAAMEDVDTYRMEMVMNITANGRTVSMSQDGVFDHEARKARLDMSVYGTEAVAYMDGDTMYVKANGGWQTQDLSEQRPWESGNGITQQRNVLESGDVSVEGTETVDGVETTVLAVDPDEGELKELLAQQQSQGFEGITIEDATYRLYVADDTDLPRKMEMTMNMSADGQSAEAEMTAYFSAYGEPVNVTVPEQATAGAVVFASPSVAA